MRLIYQHEEQEMSVTLSEGTTRSELIEALKPMLEYYYHTGAFEKAIVEIYNDLEIEPSKQ